MWGALKIPAVLKGARFALIAVHRQIARPRIAAHKAPFLARGEARPAQPAQTGLQQLFLHGFPAAIRTQVQQRLVTT